MDLSPTLNVPSAALHEAPLLPFAADIAHALNQYDKFVMVLYANAPTMDGLQIEAASAPSCAALGESWAALHGRSFGRLIAATADRQRCDQVTQALRDNRDVRAELPCTRRGGQPMWLAFHLLPVAARRWVLLGRDVTGQRVAREEQRAVQQLLIAAFQNIDAAAALADSQGIVQMANPELHRLLRYAAGTLPGRQSLDLVVAHDRPRLAQARAQHLQTGGSSTLNVDLQCGGGGVLHARLTAAVARLPDGRRFSVLTVRRRPAEATPLNVHVAGKIRLIGLEAVQNELGDRWPAVAERAMQSAEHILRRRLGPADTASRTQDGAFAVCFANATDEEAGFRAAMIGREICQRLIGKVSPHTAGRVNAIVADAPAAMSEPAPLGVAAILEQRRGALEATAREELAAALREARCVREPAYGRDKHPAGLSWLAIAPAVWQRMISAALVLGKDAAGDFDPDRLTLDLAIEHLVQHPPDNSGEAFLIGIGLDTLVGRGGAEKYLARLRHTEPILRERLVLMLSSHQEPMPRARLRECATVLRSLGVRLGLELRSLHLPALDPPPQPVSVVALPGAVLCEALETSWDTPTQVVEALHARGVRVFARRAQDTEQADALRTLGVDVVSFDAAER